MKTEIASCHNPKDDLWICKNCARDFKSKHNNRYNPKQEKGHSEYSCSGYINKKNGSLFDEK